MISACFTFLLLLSGISSDDLTAEKLLKQMFDRYQGKWYENLTFVQTTESYRNDSLIKKATWYEAILFPDKFRIDFGDPSIGDAVIYRNDSLYDFRKGQLKTRKAEKNDLTFLLGGLYFYPFKDVLEQLKAFHYDLSKIHEDRWKGRAVYIIGANNNSEKLNQLWIDKERMILVRLLKFDDGRKEDAIFENHIQVGGGWTETMVSFYMDGKLLQKEYYHNCQANGILNPAVFEPSQFGKIHWFK